MTQHRSVETLSQSYVLRQYRNASLMEELLEGLPRQDSFGRRTIVLALRLPGCGIDWRMAVPGPERAADVSAWVLPAVIADPTGARERIRSPSTKMCRGAGGRVAPALGVLRVHHGVRVNPKLFRLLSRGRTGLTLELIPRESLPISIFEDAL